MNIDVVKYLILHGADVKKPDNDGETCLMIAIHHAIFSKSGKDIEDIVQLLIDHDSDPYMRNKDGDDAFQKASLFGQESILRKLLIKFKPRAERWIESYDCSEHFIFTAVQVTTRWYFRVGRKPLKCGV